MKNVLKLTILIILIISCKLQNITGAGVNKKFVGTWIGSIEEDNANYPSIPIPQQLQDDTGETTGEREIIVTINEDGSINIDSDFIPASSIYEDVKNNIYYYTISYIITNGEAKSTTMFNYMIIFEDESNATIEGVTIITLDEKQQRLKVPQTTITKQTL